MKPMIIPKCPPSLREGVPKWLSEIVCRLLSLFHLLISILGILLVLLLWKLGFSPTVWWELLELRRTRRLGE